MPLISVKENSGASGSFWRYDKREDTINRKKPKIKIMQTAKKRVHFFLKKFFLELFFFWFFH